MAFDDTYMQLQILLSGSDISQVLGDSLGHNDRERETLVQNSQAFLQSDPLLQPTCVLPNGTGSLPPELPVQMLSAVSPNQNWIGLDTGQYNLPTPTDTKPVLSVFTSNPNTPTQTMASEMSSNPGTEGVLNVDPNSEFGKQMLGSKIRSIILRPTDKTSHVKQEPAEQTVFLNVIPCNAPQESRNTLTVDVPNCSSQCMFQSDDCSKSSQIPLLSGLETVLGDLSNSTQMKTIHVQEEPSTMQLQSDPSTVILQSNPSTDETLPWKKYARRRRVTRKTPDGPTYGTDEYKNYLDSLGPDERKKELNRQAALRCRQNKFNHEITLEKRAKELHRQKLMLQKEKQKLQMKTKLIFPGTSPS